MSSKVKDTIKAILFPVVAVIFSLFISVFFVMWAKGYSITQYFTALTDLVSTIWNGSFGTQRNTMATLAEVTPLIFTGVANAVAFRCGLFNIGVGGQFVLGMVAAAIVGTIPGLSPIVHIPLIIVSGIVAGGIWGGIPGFLKAKFGTSEVINTIMMNYISIALANYIILRTSFGVPGKAATPMIQESAKLARFVEGSSANISLFIGIITAILMGFILWKTTIGYEIRAVGINPHGAEYGGVNVAKKAVLAMILSGAIAGLGGATHVAGVKHLIQDFMVVPSYGFDGIAVALLAKKNPVACILSAILFGALNSSSRALQISGIPKEIVFLIQSVIIIFVATDYIVTYFGNKKKKGEIMNG
ncbi:ABC transporter permease [Clostridium sp.]|uniref:ABC transporter permease n=1 Tax=Clostridium sp. TaxID=1506 RepID=UPI00321751C8